jgi:diguanylate cyclase (GGDEF)-like protein
MIGKASISVLSVEDEMAHAKLLEEMLELDKSNNYHLLHSKSLESALACLKKDLVDIILLDLNLPDSWGYRTFSEIQELALDIPVILMTGISNDEIALKAIQNGAQDFLVKGEVDAKLLFRSIRYAIERHQMQSELRSLSLRDELTGLYNRRGFLTLAGQHLKLARRTGQEFFIVFADIDDLKAINDTYGHAEGDAVLMAAADILKKIIRESDILARYGGDEFLVLITDAINDSGDEIYRRLQKQVEQVNNGHMLKSFFSISVGIRCFEPSQDVNVENLIARADEALYKNKQSGR